MPLAHPQTDGEFNALLMNSGTTPVIVDFFATWCGPCRNIAPIFQELSDRHLNLKFAKVDTDKCKETAAKYQVSALPTFSAFLNGQKMDTMSGANQAGLESFVRKWSENCPSQLESPIPGQIDLLGFIDREQSECLNDHDKHPFKAFLSGEGQLLSDVDEQLIINLRFQQPVKVHSVLISAKGAKDGPKTVKLFINNTRTLDFDTAQSSQPIQTLTFEKGEELKSLYYVKFQNVNSLQLFVENNQSGSEQTVVERLSVYGTPLQATNMQEFKRVAGKAGEAGH